MYTYNNIQNIICAFTISLEFLEVFSTSPSPVTMTTIATTMSTVDDYRQANRLCSTTEVCQTSHVSSVVSTVTNISSTTSSLQPNQGVLNKMNRTYVCIIFSQ